MQSVLGIVNDVASIVAALLAIPAAIVTLTGRSRRAPKSSLPEAERPGDGGAADPSA